jgi:hypothetical protein
MDASLLPPLIVLFAVVSFLYGSVGLGGGSAYIAAMVMLGMDHGQIPILALALNLVVAGSGLAHFAGRGHFRTRLFLALVPTSVPAAYLAAQAPVSPTLFRVLLGSALLLAGLRMLATPLLARAIRDRQKDVPFWLLPLLGLGLGALAGLTGIGGGVYLGPVLMLTGLASPKQAAAICAGFIVVNSAAGLAGRVVDGATMPWPLLLPLAATVLVGGQLGAFLGARRLRPAAVQAVFGLIVLAVSIRLLLESHGGL